MFKEILLCIDIQDEASTTKAMDLCIELAGSMGSTLHILTVVPEFGFPLVGQYFPKDTEDKIIEGAKQQLAKLVNKTVPDTIKSRHIVAQGSIYDQILGMADRVNADLIVLTAHRPELKDYLLGPNAARVVRHANCSVTVVR
ncbi:MAG: universal stress protein [Magnetovibrio sp.]|nr:universal stress protein [Magnetovibrio sp.]